LAEYEADNQTPEAEYIYGMEGMLAKVDRSGGYLWYYTDHLGSLRQLGSSAMLRDYYPYGVAKTAAGNDATYQFPGHYQKTLDRKDFIMYITLQNKVLFLTNFFLKRRNYGTRSSS